MVDITLTKSEEREMFNRSKEFDEKPTTEHVLGGLKDKISAYKEDREFKKIKHEEETELRRNELLEKKRIEAAKYSEYMTKREQEKGYEKTIKEGKNERFKATHPIISGIGKGVKGFIQKQALNSSNAPRVRPVGQIRSPPNRSVKFPGSSQSSGLGITNIDAFGASLLGTGSPQGFKKATKPQGVGGITHIDAYGAGLMGISTSSQKKKKTRRRKPRYEYIKVKR